MADNSYTIDQLATQAGVTVTDDGTGIDWLDFGTGVFPLATNITLAYDEQNDATPRASGFFFNPGNTGNTLIVNGLIENVLGSNGKDAIVGNEVANVLFGDQADTGLGDDDTIGGGDGNDTIFGGSGNDSIGGAGDDDVLFGDSGNDTISGGGGIDFVDGGTGADVLSGGQEIGDRLIYFFSNAGVRLSITAGSTSIGIGGDAEGDSINGFEDVIGSEFADVITDTIKGFNGSNINAFSGEGGADTLAMGGGNDAAYGGNQNDLILGEAGSDTLFGDRDDDRLFGGAGRDSLSGGTGADRFVFTTTSDSTTATSGRDIIEDFSRPQGDKIDLRGIDAKSGGGNQAFDFIGTARFTGDKGDLRILKSGQNLIVQGDINGDKRADFAVLVEDTGNLRAGDFLL